MLSKCSIAGHIKSRATRDARNEKPLIRALVNLDPSMLKDLPCVSSPHMFDMTAYYQDAQFRPVTDIRIRGGWVIWGSDQEMMKCTVKKEGKR